MEQFWKLASIDAILYTRFTLPELLILSVLWAKGQETESLIWCKKKIKCRHEIIVYFLSLALVLWLISVQHSKSENLQQVLNFNLLKPSFTLLIFLGMFFLVKQFLISIIIALYFISNFLFFKDPPILEASDTLVTVVQKTHQSFSIQIDSILLNDGNGPVTHIGVLVAAHLPSRFLFTVCSHPFILERPFFAVW